jgi:hypothetical protein
MKRRMIPDSGMWPGSASLPDPMIVPISPTLPERPYYYFEHSHNTLIPQQAPSQQCTELHADHRLLDTMEPPDHDPTLSVYPDQLEAFSLATSCEASWPQPQLQQQVYNQDLLPYTFPHAQRSLEAASQETLVIPNGLDSWPTDAVATWLVADPSEGPCPTSAIGRASNAWYDVCGNGASYAVGIYPFSGDDDSIGSFAGIGLGDGWDGTMNGDRRDAQTSADFGACSYVYEYAYRDGQGDGYCMFDL